MTPEQLLLIDAILTLPETTPEKELQRRIAAIHAVTAYCGVEEGRPSPCILRGRPAGGDVPTIVKAKEQARSKVALSQAISSVKSDKRPTICFLCLGNPNRERIHNYASPGSLSRHFHNKHLKMMSAKEQIDCRICDIRLMHRMHLQNHAEEYHGIVSRRSISTL
jgi:Protein of unknown function (DUF3435)